MSKSKRFYPPDGRSIDGLFRKIRVKGLFMGVTVAFLTLFFLVNLTLKFVKGHGWLGGFTFFTGVAFFIYLIPLFIIWYPYLQQPVLIEAESGKIIISKWEFSDIIPLDSIQKIYYRPYISITFELASGRVVRVYMLSFTAPSPVSIKRKGFRLLIDYLKNNRKLSAKLEEKLSIWKL